MRSVALWTAAACMACSAVILAPGATGALSGAVARRADRTVNRALLLGMSVRRRPIRFLERGDPDAPSRILVVGCIHGDEPGGIGIAEQLESAPLPREVDLWVVDDANPDGVALGTRTNADGVDLNRNFAWHWRKRGSRGDRYYPGPRALSEPESRLLAKLVMRLRPQVTIWFHQPFGVVDESGGVVAIERRFARRVGLPLRRLPRYPGGATDWQNARFPGTTAFVVELNAGQLSAELQRRYARAVVAVSPRG